MSLLRFARILAAASPLVTGVVLRAPLAAQTILLRGGATSRVQVLPGSKVAVPIVLDMTAAGASNLAALTTGVAFGPARLRFDSLAVGTFGSVTLNSVTATAGTLGLSVFDARGTTTSVTLATAWFTAASTAGGTTVAFAPTVAGSDAGANILARLRVRNLDVCVAPAGKWGDVNGDGITNILDAQQIARFAVGFGVVSQALMASHGDVTGDGAVNIIDAQQIARFTVGLSAAALINTPRFVPPVIASMSLVGAPTSNLAVGESAQLLATPVDASATPQNGCVATTWTSSDPTIATVDSTGTVVGVASGTATITATAGTKTATATITIRPRGLASTLTVVSGGGQSGATSAALPQPVVIEILDAFNRGVAAATVTVAVTSGGGTVTPSSGATDASGRLSLVWTLGSTPGAQTLSVGSSGLASVAVSATASTGQNSLVITRQPGATQVAGAVLTPPLTVELRDGTNTLMASYTGAVTVVLGANPGQATLGGTTSVNAVAGVATFPAVTLNRSGTGYTLVASAAGATSATSTPFAEGPAAATSMVITSGNAQSGPTGAALTQPIVAQARDALGNAVAGVAVTFTPATGSGSVTQATGTTNASGNASTTWTLGTTVGAQTLIVASAGLTSATGTATGQSTVVTWVFTTQPGGTQTAGAALAPAIVAELHDAGNAVVTSFTGATTIAIGTNPGGAALGGSASVNAVAGVATFPNITLNKVGTGYTLVVGSGGAVSATSSVFNVAAGSASALSLSSGNGQTGTFGTLLAAPVVAKVVDAFGNAVTGTSVTFAVNAGGGSVGTPSVSTGTGGLASTTWTLGPTGNQTLSITSAGLAGSPITVSATGTAGVASQLVGVSSFPATASVGVPQSPFSVRLADAGGNFVSQANVTITGTLIVQPGAITSALTAVTDANGVATFTAATYVGPIGNATVTFTATGVASFTSPGIQILPGPASGLRQLAALQASVAAGTVLNPQPLMQVVDIAGNAIAANGLTVTVSVGSGGGTLAGTTSVQTNASGQAAFTNLSFAGPTGTRTLLFASGTLAQHTSAPMIVGVGTTTSIVLNGGAGQSATAGAAVAIAPSVKVADTFGNAVSGVAVTFTTSNGAQLSNGTTTGASVSVTTDASGIARVASWTLGTVAQAYTLSATASVNSGSPVAFTATATPGTGTQLGFTIAPPTTAGSGVLLSPQPVVKLMDAAGNAVSTGGVVITASVASGSGTLTGPAATTASDGSATFSALTVSGTAGSVVLSFAAPGYTPRSSAPITLGAGALASIAITPNPASLLAGATQQFAAVGRDAFDNVVAITPGWSVLNGGGSINSAGLFTAGNTAATYAGTVRAVSGSISALATVTVLPGPLASIVVSPATVSLTPGQTQQFAATGRDAQNNVVQITPVWSVANGGGTIGSGGLLTAATLAGSYVNAVGVTSGAVSGTASLTITAGAGAALAITTAVPASATSGTAMSAPPVLQVKDAFGNAVSTQGVVVTASIASGTGGTLTNATATTNSSGVATFTGLTLSGIAGSFTLSFSAPGLGNVVSGTLALAASTGGNTVSGSVYDAVSQAPLAGASIVLSQGGTSIVAATTATNGTWITAPLASGTYLVTVSRQGYATASIVGQQVSGATAAPAVPLVPASAQTGSISGTMINATTGQALGTTVTVELRSGINATTGTALQTVTTDATAQYLFSGVAAGTYTVLAHATGYTDASKTGVAVGNTTTSGQNIVLSPTATLGSVRIVLTWRQTPGDLDSHLTGPAGADTTNRFHVYYGGRGSCTAAPFACLDQDVTSGNGPETITISQVISGRYRYGVQNYTCCGNSGNTTDATLSQSGGVVQVYISNVLAQTFAVPTTSGSFWTVFELNGNTITPINQIGSNGPFVSVTRIPTGVDQAPIVDVDLARIMSDIRSHPKRAGIPRQ